LIVTALDDAFGCRWDGNENALWQVREQQSLSDGRGKRSGQLGPIRVFETVHRIGDGPPVHEWANHTVALFGMWDGFLRQSRHRVRTLRAPKPRVAHGGITTGASGRDDKVDDAMTEVRYHAKLSDPCNTSCAKTAA